MPIAQYCYDVGVTWDDEVSRDISEKTKKWVQKSYGLRGEHGVREVALSVPSVVGASRGQQRIRGRWNQMNTGYFYS